jgi:ATP-dependent exoDNAse (exonuclease V) alpha subunit
VATYRLSAQLVKRSAGRSATAAAAYRAGIRMADERTGLVFDYTRRHGVVHAEILAPPGSPDWMHDRRRLWNAIETTEKRKDAQLARELQLSLPHELTAPQRLNLVRQFVEAEFVARGMVADLTVHRPNRLGDRRNYHAHVMLTLRVVSGGGFGKKAREWNDVSMLEGWRAAWSDAVNRALALHGHAERIDHRSHADQEIDREPDPKLGPVATTMEQHGHASYAGADRRAVKVRNARRTELIASLADISAELDALDAVVVTPTSEQKVEGVAAAAPTVGPLLPALPVSSPAPRSSHQRRPAGWKHYLFELWSTVSRAVTVPMRVFAAVTKRRRRRQRGLTR